MAVIGVIEEDGKVFNLAFFLLAVQLAKFDSLSSHPLDQKEIR